MPLELRELTIRTTIDDQAEVSPMLTDNTGDIDQEAIVAACVKQVLQKLKQGAQR